MKKKITVTRWKHPSLDRDLILAGTPEITRAEALECFWEKPELLQGTEEEMDLEEFRALPEFEG